MFFTIRIHTSIYSFKVQRKNWIYIFGIMWAYTWLYVYIICQGGERGTAECNFYIRWIISSINGKCQVKCLKSLEFWIQKNEANATKKTNKKSTFCMKIKINCLKLVPHELLGFVGKVLHLNVKYQSNIRNEFVKRKQKWCGNDI